MTESAVYHRTLISYGQSVLLHVKNLRDNLASASWTSRVLFWEKPLYWSQCVSGDVGLNTGVTAHLLTPVRNNIAVTSFMDSLLLCELMWKNKVKVYKPTQLVKSKHAHSALTTHRLAWGIQCKKNNNSRMLVGQTGKYFLYFWNTRKNVKNNPPNFHKSTGQSQDYYFVFFFFLSHLVL